MESLQALILSVTFGEKSFTIGECLLEVLEGFNILRIVHLEHTDVAKELGRNHLLAKLNVICGRLKARRPLLHECERTSVARSLLTTQLFY